MLLSNYHSIQDLINRRIEINHHNQYKSIDVLGYNRDAGTVLIEYMFKPGERFTQKITMAKMWNWITKASRLQNRVL